jgi:hypothetical protein
VGHLETVPAVLAIIVNKGMNCYDCLKCADAAPATGAKTIWVAVPGSWVSVRSTRYNPAINTGLNIQVLQGVGRRTLGRQYGARRKMHAKAETSRKEREEVWKVRE